MVFYQACRIISFIKSILPGNDILETDDSDIYYSDPSVSPIYDLDLDVATSIYKPKENYVLLGYAKNKASTIFAVEMNYSNNGIIIRLQDLASKSNETRPNLWAKCNKNGDIYIIDCQAIHEGVGNGSILMTYFLREADRLTYKRILGYLADVDKDNWYRSIPFYKKYGFTIVSNDNGIKIIKESS